MLRATTTLVSATTRATVARRSGSASIAAVVSAAVGSPRLLHHAARSLLTKGHASASSKQTGKPDLNIGVGASVPIGDPLSESAGVTLEGETADAVRSKSELLGSKAASKNPAGARRVSTKGKSAMPGEIPIVDESKHHAKKGAKAAKSATVEVPIVEEKKSPDLKERVEEGLASMAQEMRDKKEQLKQTMQEKMRSAGETIKETVDRTASSSDMGAGSRAPMPPTADTHLPFEPSMVGKTTGVSAPQQNTSYYGSENRKMLPVTDMIKLDHELIRLLYKEYTKAIDQEIKQRKVFALIHEMARHNACEELTVYPYLRSTDKIPGSAEMADRSQKEHDAVKLELKDVDRLASDIGSTDFVAALTRAIRGFEAHAGEEEREVLPLMDKRCTRSELFNLGEHFDNAATIVTGRPHPLAPDQGVPAIMAHLTSKPLDYLRDLIAGRSDVIDEEVAAAKKKLKTSGTKPASA